jgi:ketopantoate reductase
MARVAIIGCGAMGSVYAALMASAGHEVYAVTRWPDHVEAMARHGLRVEGASGDRTLRLHAAMSTDGIGRCDLVIIATKAFDVEAMRDENAWRVARGCTEEAVAVARALGIRLEVGDPIEHIRRLGGKIAGAQPSMLLDHLARRRSEIDVINGAIPREGAKVGVRAPVNETVVTLVKSREAGFGA